MKKSTLANSPPYLGTVVAYLTLDDPSRVQVAAQFDQPLPIQENTATHGDKKHQVFQRAKADLDNILSGYILPEPHFRDRLTRTVKVSGRMIMIQKFFFLYFSGS